VSQPQNAEAGTSLNRVARETSRIMHHQGYATTRRLADRSSFVPFVSFVVEICG
jgi:hypothetical protein